MIPNSVKNSGSPEKDLALFYVPCVRSVIDYATPVSFQRSPPVLEERVGAAREKSNVNNNRRKVQLSSRAGGNTHFRASLSLLFYNIVSDPNHKLKAFLQPVYDNSLYDLKRQRHFNVPKLCTNRARNTFLHAMS